MLTIVWEFHVRPERAAEFERHYGSAGTWAAFFRRGSGYRGTRLLRDTREPLRYLTVDEWDDEPSYRRFQQDFAAEYERLDAGFEALTAGERLIGYFVE